MSKLKWQNSAHISNENILIVIITSLQFKGIYYKEIKLILGYKTQGGDRLSCCAKWFAANSVDHVPPEISPEPLALSCVFLNK